MRDPRNRSRIRPSSIVQTTGIALRGKSLLRARGFTSSLALIAGQFTKLASGALFWIVAARFFSPAEVGLAAGLVSLISISTIVGLLGAGASVIRLFPEWRRRPQPLLKSAATITFVSSAAVSFAALILARLVFDDLDVVASNPALAATFVVACVLGSVLLLGDQVSIAMWRSNEVFTRAFATGITMIAALALLASVGETRTALVILACWTVGRVFALLLNIVQIRRALDDTSDVETRKGVGVKDLLRLGVRNHVLTIFETAPGFAITIVVTEIVSPESSAYWYAAWMTATVVYVIPGMFGMTLFAAAVEPGKQLARTVRESLAGSFAVGLAVAVGVFVLAHPLLQLFGDQYAEAGIAPLRILVVGVVPLTLVSAYFALCRATDRLGEATVVAVVGGTAVLTATLVAGIEAGLVEVAYGWLGVEAVVGAWAAWRLRLLTREGVRAKRQLARS